jgi:hypothetical protein
MTLDSTGSSQDSLQPSAEHQPSAGIVEATPPLDERKIIALDDARWYAANPPIAWFRKEFNDYDAAAPGLDVYSRQLVPILEHPRILEGGEALAQDILRHRLRSFTSFTVKLELDVVNTTLQEVWLDRLGTRVSERVRAEAGRTVVEESQHAYESDRVLRAFYGDVTEALAMPHPFLEALKRTLVRLPEPQRLLVLMAATVTTETAITGTLDVIPKDPTVHPGVRAYMREHAIDEGRHYKLVIELFRQWWPTLTPAQRDLIGPMFPKMLTVYLAPDLAGLDVMLQGLGLARREAEAVLGDVYSGERLLEITRTAGRHSLRALKSLGLVDDYKEAFKAEGLW